MKIFFQFYTVNILKLNFWLVICIAKDFIWTILKALFRFFLHTQIPDFFEKWTLMTGFVVQGHICVTYLFTTNKREIFYQNKYMMSKIKLFLQLFVTYITKQNKNLQNNDIFKRF